MVEIGIRDDVTDNVREGNSMRRVLVLLPTYNEAANVTAIVEAILGQTSMTDDIDVLVIDDNSPDGTGQLADALRVRYPMRVHVLHRATKEGLGRAYAAGYAWALASDYDVVAQMDADFSHNPSDLPRLIATVSAGADVALGSRYVEGGRTPGWPWRRRLLSALGSRYAATVLGLPVHDLTGGFKAYSARAVRTVASTTLQAAGFAIQLETTYRAYRGGLSVREVPIVFRDRRAGSSKMSRRIVLEAFALPVRLRVTSPARAGRAYPIAARHNTGRRSISVEQPVVRGDVLMTRSGPTELAAR